MRQVWSFAPPPESPAYRIFCNHGGFVSEVNRGSDGGAVAALPPTTRGHGSGRDGTNGGGTAPFSLAHNRIAAFSCDTAVTQVDCWVRVFEVSPEGDEVANVTVPATNPYFIPGAYRAVTWETINGELPVLRAVQRK